MNKLQTLRNNKGLSQQKLADISHVSVRNIQYYEQGVMNIDGAKIGTLLALAVALECRISDIIQDDNLSKELQKNGY